jgi:hypothetical protein
MLRLIVKSRQLTDVHPSKHANVTSESRSVIHRVWKTLLRSSANNMLIRPRYDVPRANFANNHCLTVLRRSLSRRRRAFSRRGYHWLGGQELVQRKWRLNRVEYLITCTVSSSAR